MKTTQDLVNRVLVILGVTSQGQTPSADDAQVVEECLEPFLAQMRQTNVVYVPDPDAIDDAVFLPLATRFAMEVAPDFALPVVPDDAKSAADGTIRRIVYPTDTYGPIRFRNF